MNTQVRDVQDKSSVAVLIQGQGHGQAIINDIEIERIGRLVETGMLPMAGLLEHGRQFIQGVERQGMRISRVSGLKRRSPYKSLPPKPEPSATEGTDRAEPAGPPRNAALVWIILVGIILPSPISFDWRRLAMVVFSGFPFPASEAPHSRPGRRSQQQGAGAVVAAGTVTENELVSELPSGLVTAS